MDTNVLVIYKPVLRYMMENIDQSVLVKINDQNVLEKLPTFCFVLYINAIDFF